MTTFIMYGCAAIIALCGITILLAADGIRDRIFALCSFAAAAAAVGGAWYLSDSRIIASAIREDFASGLYCTRCHELHPIAAIESEEMEESEYTGYNWTARVTAKPTANCRNEEVTTVKIEYEWPCVMAVSAYDPDFLAQSRQEEPFPSGISEAQSNEYARIAGDYRALVRSNDARLDEKWDEAEARLLPLISAPDLPDTNAISRIVRELREADDKDISDTCERMQSETNCPTWFYRHAFLSDGDAHLRIVLERVRMLSNLEGAIHPKADPGRARLLYARYRAGAVYVKAVRSGDDEATAKRKAKNLLETLR